MDGAEAFTVIHAGATSNHIDPNKHLNDPLGIAIPFLFQKKVTLSALKKLLEATIAAGDRLGYS